MKALVRNGVFNNKCWVCGNTRCTHVTMFSPFSNDNKGRKRLLCQSCKKYYQGSQVPTVQAVRAVLNLEK